MVTIRHFEMDWQKGTFSAKDDADAERMIKAAKELHALGFRAPQPSQAASGGASPAIRENLPSNPLTWPEIVEKFFLLKSHSKTATKKKYRQTMLEFAEYLGNPQARKLTKEHVTKYKEYLALRKNDPRTIDNKVGVLRAVINFAIDNSYFYGANPASGKPIMSKKQKQRQGWAIFEDYEIQQFFASETFQKEQKNDPAYYWTTVLSLVSGARISEITALLDKRIRQTDSGTWYFRIADAKTLAGERKVPIPTEVIDAAGPILKDKKGQIFRYTVVDGKGAGNAASKKFTRQLEALKLKRPKLVFHSLRKYANNFFQKEGISLELRSQFFGHELDEVNIQNYTKEFSPDEMLAITKATQLKLFTLTLPPKKSA